MTLPIRDTVDGYRIFTGHNQALGHLCDHVLTAPECDAWRVLVPDLDALMAASPNARYDLARRAWNGDCHAVAEVHAQYLQSIIDNRACAVVHGLLATAADEHGTPTAELTLGLDGVLAVVDLQHRAVVTAFVPGAGVPWSGDASSVDRSRNPLPRESSPSTSPPGRRAFDTDGWPCRRKPISIPRERERLARRQASWSQPQQVFQIFKRARSAVSNAAFSRSSTAGLRDYYLLAEPLRQRRLHTCFEAWQEARSACAPPLPGKPPGP